MDQVIPEQPKIFHIVHIDTLPSIIKEGCLWSDAHVQVRSLMGTSIGMSHIKERRIKKSLSCYPSLKVGACVPFYFCPRSVMLYILHRRNHPDMVYQAGQSSIVHLQADLLDTIKWADQNNKKWVFTTSNAGSNYFEDFADLKCLNKIDWTAVNSVAWKSCREEKQAEFLIEERFPWSLVENVGVYSSAHYSIVQKDLVASGHKPIVNIRLDWYY